MCLLAYPQQYNGYLCYDPRNKKTYISMNVWFIEEDFSLNLLLEDQQERRLPDEGLIEVDTEA